MAGQFYKAKAHINQQKNCRLSEVNIEYSKIWKPVIPVDYYKTSRFEPNTTHTRTHTELIKKKKQIGDTYFLVMDIRDNW